MQSSYFIFTGLFNPSHMEYSPDRSSDIGGEPSLTNMTEFAIKMLGKNKKGFFLLVEGRFKEDDCVCIIRLVFIS